MLIPGCGDRPTSRTPLSPLTGADVRTCGAVADGSTLDTLSIQSAIDRVAAGGGGVVDFPPGQYLTGTLFLRTGVKLHLQKDAVLLGSTNYYDYYNLTAVDSASIPKTIYSQDEAKFSAMILSLDQHDIAVTGDGEIDGRGTVFAENVHQLQAARLIPGNANARPDESVRPALINFVRCQNIVVKGITLRDSACWCEVYCDCDGVDVSDLSVRSIAYWNNDGIDICGSKNVRVTNFDAEVSDDGICLKSNTAAVENVTISHCKIDSWANGIKLGTASCIGFSNVNIDHVQITGAGHSGVAIESVDGADIHDIKVSDVTMTGVTNGLFVKLGDRHRRDGMPGRVSGISFKNISGSIRVDDPDGPPTIGEPYPPNPRGFDHNFFPPVIVSGFPGHPVNDVHFDQVQFVTPGGGTTEVANAPIKYLSSVLEYADTYPEYSMHGELPAMGWFCRHVSGLTFSRTNVTAIEEDYRPFYVFDDVTDLRGDDFKGEGNSTQPLVVIRDVKAATLNDPAISAASANTWERFSGCSGIVFRGLVKFSGR